MDFLNYEKMPSNSLGAKYLDTKQMETNFPDYNNLLDRIEEQRELAEYITGSAKNTGSRISAAKGAGNLQRYPQMYDNVFAILGGRGSGKSSVIQSLHEYLQNGRDNIDIVFPIIIPELISDPHCSILGWIMATAEQVIDSIEEQFRQLEKERGGRWICDNMAGDPLFFFKDCHLQHSNKLRENYESLKRDCIPDYSFSSEFSYEDAVGIQVNLSQKQYDLAKNLNIFWDDVTIYWRNLKILQAKKEKRDFSTIKVPLIILMFDDVDLVPERSLELLNSTFQYFTNPNIVLILTAAEKVLAQVIWTKMLERMLGSNYRSLFTDFYTKDGFLGNNTGNPSLESIDRMAREYYDKVVPPANRYFLKRYFTIAERKHYRYATTGQSIQLPEDTVSIELEEFLHGQIEDLEKCTGVETSIGDGKGKIKDIYLLMFGNKSRNIANGCLAILNCVSRLKQCLNTNIEGNSSDTWHDVYNALWQLLKILISSNNLTKELNLSDAKLLYQASDIGVVINYNDLWKIYANRKEMIEDDYPITPRQKGEWEDDDGSHDETFLRMEQKELRKLQKQVSILLVMLNFVDGLKSSVSGKLRRKKKGKKDGEDSICGLAGIINSAGYSQLFNRGIAGNWSWLSLFPKNLSIDAFLLRFPYVLEHIDHYAEFDPFDEVKTQEYLIDIFYSCALNCQNISRRKSTIKKGSIEERIRSHNCPPELLLLQGVSNEQAWVKTVLAMIFLRYSGVTEIDSSFLNFSNDSRAILEIFSFGGRLNTEMRKEMTVFLKGDLRTDTLRKTVNKLFSRMPEATGLSEESKKVLEEFKNKKFDSLNTIHSWYYNDVSETIRKEIAEYILADCIARNKERKSVDKETFAGWLIQLVEENIDMAGLYLKNGSEMQLTYDTCQSILDLLSDVPPITDELQMTRRACLHELEKIEKSLKPCNNDGEAEETISGETKKTASYKLTDLLDYLLILYKEISPKKTSDRYRNYWFLELIKGYFELAAMLDPDLNINGSFEKNEERFDQFFNNQEGISPNGKIILILNIIETLLPTYFAAKLLQKNVVNIQGDSISSNQYPGIENVSARISKTYYSLINEELDIHLCQMMSEVREQMAELYIEYLEDNKDEYIMKYYMLIGNIISWRCSTLYL